MVATRTYAHYWSDDELAPLLAKAADLREDFEERARFISTENKAAMLDRLNNLDIAIRLLGDIAQ